MKTREREIFTTIRTEGAILPFEILQRISERNNSIDGLDPLNFHLAKGEKLNEAINRSWNRLLGAWESFKRARDLLSSDDIGTTITRERWLLILFQELGYGRLLTAKSLEISGKIYPISHLWHHTPIHLVGYKVDLDRRSSGVAGAARMSPHSLVQELLNRSECYLWGMVSNGLVLRLLRDNVSLTRQAYVEFDLEAMMDGLVYSDFVLLWLVCHESRVESERPEECWLENWSNHAKEYGTRALDQLRSGVEQAITYLGQGFISTYSNTELRDKLRSGTLTGHEYYRQLLRMVYRLLFLFSAEDRNLLLDPNSDQSSKERYNRFYSISRLRLLAQKKVGTKHTDLYQGLLLVMTKLNTGCSELALPALGSFLWSKNAISDIAECNIENSALLNAIRSITYITDNGIRRSVDFKNLGSEELGSIYESLLELHPLFNLEIATFELTTAGGNERKTTGSYYTPTSLINSILDTTLEPVLDKALKNENPEFAILNLKICDPACGSGHFLIAASYRIAKRLAIVRTGDDEPSPNEQRKALRDVIGNCIYGVDLNDMAVELCKVSLWMEALEPGKPLSFLDHHIQCGNSLLGVTPNLFVSSLPDDAFKPIEGDDRTFCTEYKRQNRKEKAGEQLSLFDPNEQLWGSFEELADGWSDFKSIKDTSIEGILSKEKQYKQMISSSKYSYNRLLADAWCAAFVWRKTKDFSHAITESVLQKIKKDPNSVPSWLYNEIRRLATQYQFFHFHLAFPDVFHVGGDINTNSVTGWSGGFDVILGNPPWERVKLQEKEWFASREPEIAQAPNAAARQRLIKKLAEENPSLYKGFIEDRRKSEGESHFIRDSGKYPLCGRGDINTYAIFTEKMRQLISPQGRVGCIVPSGIAFDDTTKFFFQDLMESGNLISLFDFENKDAIFQNVHRSYKFCLLTIHGGEKSGSDGTKFTFFAHSVDDLDRTDQVFTLNAKDIELVNPNTKTCPIFRFKRDADITTTIYEKVPVLIKEGVYGLNPWGIRFSTLFHMANDSEGFQTKEQLEQNGWQLDLDRYRKENISFVRLYEAKMMHQFDHRWLTYNNDTTINFTHEEKNRVTNIAIPRYWTSESDLDERLNDKWEHQWLFGWRDIVRATDERTVISTIIPRVATGNTILLMMPESTSAKQCALLQACLCSFVFDYIARQKVGGIHLTYHIMKQLPVIPPDSYKMQSPWEPNASLEDWIVSRVLELTYTAVDLEPFARDLGYGGEPFKWNEERRFDIRCELDAAYFLLYGVSRPDIEYIMDTFPIVKRRDEEKYIKYRTKEKILEFYDGFKEEAKRNSIVMY
jgi:hypothetical protein